MLQFLRKLLKKEPQEIVVAFSRLEDFLKERAKPHEESLEKELRGRVEEIEGLRKSILEDIKKVETANLQNPNIPYRAKVIMQGNRDAFVRSIGRFFSTMAFSYESTGATIQRSRQLQKEMDELAKTTARSYAILSQFFEKEMEPILASIKKIDGHLKAILSLCENNESAAMHRMIKEVTDIKEKIRMREQWLYELEKEARHLDSQQSTKEKTQERIGQKKESREYWEYEQLLKKKDAYEQALVELENTLFHDFSDLERALKKYSKISLEHEKRIVQYLENAMQALLSDEKLEVISMLENMKKSINSLDLDEKKQERVLARISTLTHDYFSHIQGSYQQKQKLLKDIIQEIEQNAEREELILLEQTLHRITLEIDQRTSRMQKMNESIASIDIHKLKKDLQSKISERLSEKIIVSDSAQQEQATAPPSQ